MKLAIVGAGYVGLVTAACFAEMGNEVICVDAEEAKVEALKAGRIPIYEPGLEDYVKRNHQENRLFFTTDLAEAVKGSLVVFIAGSMLSGASQNIYQLIAFRALQGQDYPGIMATVFVFAAIIIVTNLVADSLYAYADPGIRLG